MAVWTCTQCGNTVEGRCRPAKCPKCGAAKESLKKAETK
ncbi:MAG: RCKP-type rubredoxin-like domain-containing protein [Syntrophothermus sp.]